MEHRMDRKKRGLAIAAAVLVILAVVLAVNHETTRIVFWNWFAASEKLDDTDDWDGGTSYEFLPYADLSKAQYLHLYVPNSSEPMPLLVLIHGGGFYFNDNESRQTQFMYRYFRDHGYACASINYRLGDEAGYPAALEDVKAAIRFLRANAGRYGYRADQFAVWGESAGGYLAVMAGVTGDDEFDGVPFIGEADLGEPVSSEVSVIVDFYGATEVGREGMDYGELGVPGWVLKLAGLWLQSAIKDSGYDDVHSAWFRQNVKDMPQEELDKVNPSYYIKKNLNADTDKYVIIRHGDADLDVPYTHSEHIYRLFQEVIGASKVEMEIKHNYKHAADRFYSDEALSVIRESMDDYFGN